MAETTHYMIHFLRIPMALIALLMTVGAYGQYEDSTIKQLVVDYKDDTRGPYKDIRWFCTDGSARAAKGPCPETGGYQRARYKDEVVALSDKKGIYLGQLLKGSTYEEFCDHKNEHSRAKQYILEKYLYANDDGWILQKAKYYRGSVQAEDEESWGRDFLLWAMGGSRFAPAKYSLHRKLTKYIPHGTTDNT